MKFYIVLLSGLCFLSACNGQSSALKKANEVKEAIAAARPGTVPTTENTWTMKAEIDGTPWKATSIMPPKMAGRIVGYYDVAYIAINYNEQDMVAGKKIEISEDSPVDLSLGHDADAWVGKNGEVEITKVTGEWVEGRFHFSATTSKKTNTIEVTNGFFRVSMK